MLRAVSSFGTNPIAMQRLIRRPLCRGEGDSRTSYSGNARRAPRTMNEYLGFLIVPGTYVYRQAIRFSVLRPEEGGAVLIHEGVAKSRFRTEKRALAAALAAARAYIDSLSRSD